MPPKKDKKGKGKDAPGDQITAVDRTFYELTITDLNNKLARLRTHVSKIEETNDDLVEQMRQFEEDRTDVTAHLDRSVTEKDYVILELNEHLTELAKQRQNEMKQSTEKIKDLEHKYKAMHEQCTSEIKLLNGKLNSLEEFRITRDDLLSKFDEQETHFREQERKHKEFINEVEQKGILEKDQLKKDVEIKLLQLSEDFTKSSEIRIAGYTRRLIRENIALTKEMDKMMLSQQRMEAENETILKNSRDLNEKFQTNEVTKQRLVKTCQNQIEILEKLTKQYEILKKKYVELLHFKKVHQDSLKRDVIDKFAYSDMSKKIRIMAQRIEMVKVDKQKLITIHIQHENEILKLREILKNINCNIQSAIRGENEPCFNDQPFREAQRTALLSELQRIIADYNEDIAITPSVSTISSTKSTYRPGQAGFIPKSKAALLELFKREAKKIASAELLSPQLKQKTSDGKITPQPRILGSETLFDIEIGSTLVFSSSSENLADIIQEEENQDEEGGMGSSSSAASVEKPPPPKEDEITKLPSAELVSARPSTKPSSKPSSKSALNTEDGDYEGEGEGEGEYDGFDEGEEEDNEINLFY